MSKLVSVVITTRNRARLLLRALRSVLEQGYGNLEIIVVNDFSSDDTRKVLKEFSRGQKNLRFFNNPKNLGIVKSLNLGIKNARGFYIARLDDDDAWLDKEKLSKQVRFLDSRPDYVLVGGGMIVTNKSGKEVSKHIFLKEDGEIRKQLLARNLFAHSSVLFRKDAWEKSLGYEPEFEGLEDKALWLKMGLKGKMHNLPEYLIRYSGHNPKNLGYAASRFSKKERLKTSLKLIKKYSKFYPGSGKAIFYAWARFFRSYLLE